MRRYLVVDDNAPLADNLAEILRDDGDEALVASSGAEALALIRTTRFDVLVTDMKMPGMNGAQLVHETRKVDTGLTAIVVTAYTGDADLASVANAGVLAILSKPVPIAQLIHLLRSARRSGVVAIVEDDRGLSDNLTEVLRDRGFTTVTAASVRETDAIGPVLPFVVLVDLNIPGGPTGEAMRHVSARFPSVPLLLMTAYDKEPPPVDVWGTFIKPFDTRKLMDVVEQLHRTAAVPPTECLSAPVLVSA